MDFHARRTDSDDSLRRLRELRRALLYPQPKRELDGSGPEELGMKRGQKTSAEQVVLKLRQTEVLTAHGKCLTLACKEAEISEQS